jgi:hypothetical protein
MRLAYYQAVSDTYPRIIPDDPNFVPSTAVLTRRRTQHGWKGIKNQILKLRFYAAARYSRYPEVRYVFDIEMK